MQYRQPILNHRPLLSLRFPLLTGSRQETLRALQHLWHRPADHLDRLETDFLEF